MLFAAEKKSMAMMMRLMYMSDAAWSCASEGGTPGIQEISVEDVADQAIAPHPFFVDEIPRFP